mmetsp:Transcript_2546/g.6101  ORF Transcript_2546/g.6101 Transcript_2546/m.6101 type:complete len:283 (-) Transcript_2546:1347-2195(-)
MSTGHAGDELGQLLAVRHRSCGGQHFAQDRSATFLLGIGGDGGRLQECVQQLTTQLDHNTLRPDFLVGESPPYRSLHGTGGRVFAEILDQARLLLTQSHKTHLGFNLSTQIGTGLHERNHALRLNWGQYRVNGHHGQLVRWQQQQKGFPRLRDGLLEDCILLRQDGIAQRWEPMCDQSLARFQLCSFADRFEHRNGSAILFHSTSQRLGFQFQLLLAQSLWVVAVDLNGGARIVIIWQNSVIGHLIGPIKLLQVGLLLLLDGKRNSNRGARVKRRRWGIGHE